MRRKLQSALYRCIVVAGAVLASADGRAATPVCGGGCVWPQPSGGAAGGAVAPPTQSELRAAARSIAAAGACDDGTFIDVMVVYTEAARIGAGGVAQIEGLIDGAVADANAALARSLIDTSFRLVHTEEVEYLETGQWMIDGPRLVDPNDGELDGVHALRDAYGADCVSLWVETLDAGGIGYFPDASLTGVGASGFSLLRRDNAALLTFAHELGHNLYCAHDRPHHVPPDPFAEYSYGYTHPSGVWRTIMSVDTPPLIPYFANPNVEVEGPNPPDTVPTGVPVGQMDPSDVALTINETRHIVANFRPTAVPGLPAVLHVRAEATPGGDGTSWATAFDDLSAAMCAAAGSGGAVQEVWVKAGAYTPGRGSGERGATFRLRDGLAIYGGFNGSETLREQRDPVANVTVLSGDIGTIGEASDNVYHVVTGSMNDATAVVDGFTISGGQADGVDPDDGGAGVLVYGGGTPRFVNCRIEGNVAARYGAGVYSIFGSSPTFEDCVFADNTVQGGAWPEGGGGAYNYSFCNPQFTRCVFEGNAARFGGATASLFDCVPQFTGCVVRGNTAGESGGGLYNYSNCPVALTNCLVTGNAADYGGGLANLFTSDAALASCTIVGNSAVTVGGGLYFGDTGTALANTILWANTAGGGGGELGQLDGWNATPSFNHCTVEGWTGAWGGTANDGNNPQFRDADGLDGVFGTADDNARLRAGSPAVDAGDDGAIPGGVSTDLDGRPRVLDAAVDRGAYEFAPPAPGDFDGDGAIGLDDYGPLAECLNGPETAPAPAAPISVPDCLAAFDFDGDGDVDLADFAWFAAAVGA